MPTTVIVGTQWGDEGKGKITDYYAEDADLVVRFQGGANAGHTVQIGGETFKFHLLPSGILRPEKKCVIANGVVVDPEQLLKEIEELKEKGYEVDNLFISERANVIMPYHKIMDGLEESIKGSMKAGTTKRGIGPCYADKVARFGIRMVDLINPAALAEKLDMIVPIKQKLIYAFGGDEFLSKNEIYKQYANYGERLKRYIIDSSKMINDAIDRGENVLFEGAQGTHLGIDHGIYPYGTSSNTVAGSACTGAGVGPGKIDKVIGVVKAYTSRVGTGPFPTELDGKLAEFIRERGGEFGTTTGRPRRVGWLDLVMVRYSVRVNGLSSLAVTKLDVLGGIRKVKVCTAYKVDGETIEEFPTDMKLLERCVPVYDELDGWKGRKPDDWTKTARLGYDALPDQMKSYLDYMSDHLDTPIDLISIGPGREDTIDLRK